MREFAWASPRQLFAGVNNLKTSGAFGATISIFLLIPMDFLKIPPKRFPAARFHSATPKCFF